MSGFINVTELLGRPESEEFDRKSALDPTVPEYALELLTHLAAMANTRGGRILIGTRGSPIPRSHLPFFDSARLDDKLNSFLDPRIGGITSAALDDDLILLEIEKSSNPPHVFKFDGTYANKLGKSAVAFRKGDVHVRHSSKTEKAERVDFDRWLEERQQKLLDRVKMVFDASPTASVQIVEGHSGMPVRIDPDAPGAQPVYDLLTPEPFRNLAQELTGAIKAWKTSRQLLNEAQIYKAYEGRGLISDAEVLELLLRSGWERHMPGYLWAGRVDGQKLCDIIAEILSANRYPSAQESLKVAALLPRDRAKPLFTQAEGSPGKSLKKAARKFEPVLRARARKFESLRDILCQGTRLTYIMDVGQKVVEISSVNEATFDEILGTLVTGDRKNRAVFKTAELLVFGPLVAQITFPSGDSPSAENEDSRVVQMGEANSEPTPSVSE